MATDRPQNLGPVRDLRVSISGMGAVFDTWTDDTGHYEARLLPGKYMVTFMPPVSKAIGTSMVRQRRNRAVTRSEAEV